MVSTANAVADRLRGTTSRHMKTAATCSDGETLSSGTYRKYEGALGLAQRAHKKGRVRAIHAKVTNTRKDALHKFSTKLVARNAAIFVGNVQSSAMVKTKMAKSALDAGVCREVVPRRRFTPAKAGGTTKSGLPR